MAAVVPLRRTSMQSAKPHAPLRQPHRRRRPREHLTANEVERMVAAARRVPHTVRYTEAALAGLSG
jgi:hypothetical protein